MVSIGDLNPFGAVGFGGLGTFATYLLIFFIIVMFLVIVGVIIFIFVIKKQYFLRIRCFRKVGNTPTEIAKFVAREIPMGMAGDKLWRVAPNSNLQMAFKVIKWLPVGKKQTAPNEFWYWIREDGEWINFTMEDLDEVSRKAGVKFLKEDMRLQRLATDRLLEQRLMDKGFWDKWGNTIMTLIVFLVVAVCMVIIFYQWSKLIDKMIPLVDSLTKPLAIVEKSCPILTNSTIGGVTGLVPA